MICDNLSVNEAGHLAFCGHDTLELARQYGTPLYLMDEEQIRRNCRRYLAAMRQYFGQNALPLYASKANCFQRIYEIIKEEGLGVDVVSMGEIYTAAKAGFPLERAYFHSNNKTDEDIDFAMDHKVGYFVVDCIEELTAIEAAAASRGLSQKVLLRLTPGIDPHTYEAISTGKVDSKFGSAIETGQAEEITKYCMSLPHVQLMGFHCHIGSQVFDADTYLRSSVIMLDFIAKMQRDLGLETKELDLGGGFGVRYTDSDPSLEMEQEIQKIAEVIAKTTQELGITPPAIRMEPGRSIVADAGLTLYTAGSVKRIPGYKNYVSIDGGMTDNPRFALYGAKYTLYNAGKMNQPKTLTADVVGRCCESGDIIQKDVALAETQRGDTVAVLTTGAYNYSMASNYNRVCRPALVMVQSDRTYVAVRRETLEYLTQNDV